MSQQRLYRPDRGPWTNPRRQCGGHREDKVRAQFGQTPQQHLPPLAGQILILRALDVLMRPLQITSAETARAMGLAWSDIRLVEAPLWGQDWAPADRVRIVLAANPWGAQLDPALVRRVHPLPAGFSEAVLEFFQEPVRGAIRASWAAVESGQLPLPVEYQLLLTANAPDDARIFTPYLHRLRALDSASAEGFQAILAGLGIETGGAA